MDIAATSNTAKCSIDLGLHFAYSRRRQLLSLALFPLGLKLLSSLWQLSPSFSLQHLFLVSVFHMLADSWLLAATVMLGIYVARGGEVPPNRRIVMTALQFLPKIFISYCLLSIIVGSAFLLFPLLIFAVFFIWTPFFCAAETFVPHPVRRSVDEDDEEYDDERDGPKVVTWLSNKSSMEMGFARSVHTAGANVWTTLQLALFVCFAGFVPTALLASVSPTYGGFFSVVSYEVVSIAVSAFVFATAGITFIACLPEAARKELGVSPNWEWNLLPERTVRFRFQGRPWVIGFLILATGFAVASILDIRRQSMLPPDSLRASVENVSWIEERIRLELRMQDHEAEFRWLKTDGLRLRFQVDSVGSTSGVGGSNRGAREPATSTGASNATTTSITSETATDRDSAGREILPTQIRLKNTAGNEIVLPTNGQLGEYVTLVLYFEVPTGKASQTALLDYVSQFKDRQLLSQFVIPKK